MLKAPDPVRSPQLSNIWTSQYYGGGPHGNTGCCSFCNSFLSIFERFSSSLHSLSNDLCFFCLDIKSIQTIGYDGQLYTNFCWMDLKNT